MIKIALFAVGALFLAVFLKQQKAEYAMLLALVTGVVIFGYGLSEVLTVKTQLAEILSGLPFDMSFLKVLVKMMGVAYIGEFVENLCRDNGYQAIAAPVDLFSRLTILVLGIPLIKYVIQIVGQFL